MSTGDAENPAPPAIASHAESTTVSQRSELDDELRALAKRLIDAGQIDRAMALLATLAEPSAKATETRLGDVTRDTSVTDNVVPLNAERVRRGR